MTASLGVCNDVRQAFLPVRVDACLVFQSERVLRREQDGPEWVVQLMGDARRQDTQGGQTIRPFEVRLQLSALADVSAHRQNGAHAPGCGPDGREVDVEPKLTHRCAQAVLGLAAQAAVEG